MGKGKGRCQEREKDGKETGNERDGRREMGCLEKKENEVSSERWRKWNMAERKAVKSKRIRAGKETVNRGGEKGSQRGVSGGKELNFRTEKKKKR